MDVPAIETAGLSKSYGGHPALAHGLQLGDLALLLGSSAVLVVVALVALERRDLAV